jgi:threonine dehydrogenase-like Zn-dependent dehydrogenase
MEQAIAAVLDGRLDPFPLLTHQVTLDTLDRGFALASERPEGFMKAWARV